MKRMIKVLLKVDGTHYVALTNFKGDIVYKEIITEKEYIRLGGM
jgi:hypothetical protein